MARSGADGNPCAAQSLGSGPTGAGQSTDPHHPGQRQITDSTDNTSANEEGGCRLEERIGGINRVDAHGQPRIPGAVKPKDRTPRSMQRVWILSADATFVTEYGRNHIELLEVYHEAKCAWRDKARMTAAGLRARGIALRLHTLLGTLPLVD